MVEVARVILTTELRKAIEAQAAMLRDSIAQSQTELAAIERVLAGDTVARIVIYDGQIVYAVNQPLQGILQLACGVRPEYHGYDHAAPSATITAIREPKLDRHGMYGYIAIRGERTPP